jgi:hypothetical protein
MNRPARFLAPALCVATALIASGCGKSPTAPEAPTTDPAPTPTPVQEPVAAVIQSISVTKFPSKKLDGSDWDASLFTASRRPDPYVTLEIPSTLLAYVSNVVTDAEFGKTYTFTQPYDAFSGSLPARIPYGSSYRIYVMDKDVGSDDDRVGWITVDLPHAYPNDNTTDLDYTFADSGDRIHVRVRGHWTY